MAACVARSDWVRAAYSSETSSFEQLRFGDFFADLRFVAARELDHVHLAAGGSLGFPMQLFPGLLVLFYESFEFAHDAARGALGRGLIAKGELEFLVLLVGPANKIESGEFLFNFRIPPFIALQKSFIKDELLHEFGLGLILGQVGAHPAVIKTRPAELRCWSRSRE